MIATFHAKTLFHFKLFLVALKRFLWFAIFFLENRNPKGSLAEASGSHPGVIWEVLWEALGDSGELWGVSEGWKLHWRKNVAFSLCFIVFSSATDHFPAEWRR